MKFVAGALLTVLVGFAGGAVTADIISIIGRITGKIHMGC